MLDSRTTTSLIRPGIDCVIILEAKIIRCGGAFYLNPIESEPYGIVVQFQIIAILKHHITKWTTPLDPEVNFVLIHPLNPNDNRVFIRFNLHHFSLSINCQEKVKRQMISVERQSG